MIWKQALEGKQSPRPTYVAVFRWETAGSHFAVDRSECKYCGVWKFHGSAVAALSGSHPRQVLGYFHDDLIKMA